MVSFPTNFESENFIQVNDANLVVRDSSGNILETQYSSMDNVTSNLRTYYTEAYLGQSSKQTPKYWLIFQASVPPLGWDTYFISKGATKGRCSSFFSLFMAYLSCSVQFVTNGLRFELLICYYKFIIYIA